MFAGPATSVSAALRSDRQSLSFLLSAGRPTIASVRATLDGRTPANHFDPSPDNPSGILQRKGWRASLMGCIFFNPPADCRLSRLLVLCHFRGLNSLTLAAQTSGSCLPPGKLLSHSTPAMAPPHRRLGPSCLAKGRTHWQFWPGLPRRSTGGHGWFLASRSRSTKAHSSPC
jgi:hypothetical protein